MLSSNLVWAILPGWDSEVSLLSPGGWGFLEGGGVFSVDTVCGHWAFSQCKPNDNLTWSWHIILRHFCVCEQTTEHRIFHIFPSLPALQGHNPSSAPALPHSPHLEQTPRAEIPQDTLHQQEKLMDPPGSGACDALGAT